MSLENKIDYSIIIPVYYNEESLPETFEKLYKKVIKYSNKRGEIVFVDDGSGDNSFDVLLSLKNKFPDLIKIVKFTRNFGQPYARLAGYKHANGECFIHISADLQDPPELINEMLYYYFEKKYEIVICEREEREDSMWRRLSSKMFYMLIKKLYFSNMPNGGFDYHLIGKKVRKLIIESNDANPFFQGQILWTGFNAKFIPYTRKERKFGKSKWTFAKKFKLFIDGVVNYSVLPLRLVSSIGFFVSIIGFLYALIILAKRIFVGTEVQGWTSVMIIILILAGIQMMMLGVIGEYLWRIFEQTKNREKYIIEKIYD